MADRRGLGFIGWAFGVVTATVILISGVVVGASTPEAADTATLLTVSTH